MAADNLKSSQEALMSEADLANAEWWVWLWDEIEKWAFFGVVLALAIEFAALRFGAPYKHSLEIAKDLKIAELNNETARLRKRVAPRTIGSEISVESLKKFAGTRAEILFVKEDPDSFWLANQISILLSLANWEAPPPRPILGTEGLAPGHGPSAVSVSGQPSGISVVGHQMDGEAYRTLADIFMKSFDSVGGGIDATMPPDMLRIVVAPRL